MRIKLSAIVCVLAALCRAPHAHAHARTGRAAHPVAPREFMPKG